ncbi:FecR family protein [Mariniphaga anaerophila]|uniref:FecR family protein n=1 Tax=Mariniphaga anaerophila TaxID=1484053 RepID=A0A1M5GAK4_9BACT|nr:FecR domain-containing protein [Mariniphaga anaerophila]SHG00726.1 FecR family protein [Mariniphaga anaerophila]
MNIYDQIIDNPLFFKWVFNPSEELDSYWRFYMEKNPEYVNAIIDLKEQLGKYCKYQKEEIAEPQKEALKMRIVHMLNTVDRKRSRTRFFRNAMRYAAISLMFFAIGGGLVYYYMERNLPQVIIDNATVTPPVEQPVLILGNRGQVSLNQGESQLEYSVDGNIRVNNEKTIEGSDNNSVPEINTLVTPYGSRTAIKLSDGSKVWLNAGSKLIYPSRFVDKTREVFLIGEAFFDVSRNEKQPFAVRTGEIKIEVLGTKFNVNAYPEDSAVQTVLAEGSVIIKNFGYKKKKEEILLEPGMLAYYSKKTRQTKTKSVNVDEYVLWTEGLFSFTNTDLNRIIKKLERYYNVHFQFSDPFNGGIKVSGKLDVTKERKEVFEYLQRLTGLQIIEVDRKHYVIK